MWLCTNYQDFSSYGGFSSDKAIPRSVQQYVTEIITLKRKGDADAAGAIAAKIRAAVDEFTAGPIQREITNQPIRKQARNILQMENKKTSFSEMNIDQKVEIIHQLVAGLIAEPCGPGFDDGTWAWSTATRHGLVKDVRSFVSRISYTIDSLLADLIGRIEHGRNGGRGGGRSGRQLKPTFSPDAGRLVKQCRNI